MALDLIKTFPQIDTLTRNLSGVQGERSRRLSAVVAAMQSAVIQQLAAKIETGRGRPFLFATPVDPVGTRYKPTKLPADFCVASVDGSHIDVDRHNPVRCYLINIGGCVLTYGSQPDARLFSQPRLYSAEEELYMASSAPDTNDTVAVQGAILGLVRAVEEVRGLAEAVRDLDPHLPVLALIDGSLVMWGLAGRGYQPFVRDEILGKGLLPALESLQNLAMNRTLSLAAYVSLPQTTEVVNTMRLALCSQGEDECQRSCSSFRSTHNPCDAANGFLDRHLFQETLAPGERSGTYRSNSSVSRDYYGPHEVCFYYLNTGNEIGRVEIPQWVAQDEGTLALSHTLILDQARRGMGYPEAIAEAHEQAVVTGQDRESFRQMVDAALDRQHLPVYTSEKNRSKRTRWL